MGLFKSKEDKETLKAKINNFNATKKIGNFFWINENNNTWTIPELSTLGNVKDITIHNFNEITNFELLEDGKSIASGGVGRALVGGALFGGVGAIVGGSTGKKKSSNVCTSYKIKITLNNFSDPTCYINFISGGEFKKSSSIYKLFVDNAQQVLSLLELIVAKNNSFSSVSSDPTKEIQKYKTLLDKGIITQDEFARKKKELLNL